MTAPPGPESSSASSPARGEPRDVVMQRVRVGVTGLAAVFLLTLLAASIFSLLGQDDHGARLANGAPAGALSNSADDTPKEPLAELGVAPGANPPKPAVSVTPAPAATPPVTLYPPPPPPVQGNAAAPPAPQGTATPQ